MQIWWLAGLRRVAFDPIEKSWAAWQTPRDDVADKRLAFHDRDIRLAGNGNEIIGGVAAQRAGGSEMKWNCDLMHGFSIQVHRPMRRLTRARASIAPAQAHDANVIAIVDFELARELGRNFDKHLRLQFGKMAEKTRHPAAGMVLGQPISGENIRKTRIAWRRETVFSFV